MVECPAGKLAGLFMRFTIRDLMWLTVVVAAFCTGTQLDRYLEQHRADPSEATIRAALDQNTDVKFTEKPLYGVINDLKQRHGIEIQVDYRALGDASIPLDAPVTRSIKGVTLRSALNLLLNDLDLTYVVQNGALMVTTKAEAQKLLSTPFSLKTAMWLTVAAAVLLGAILCDRAWRRRAFCRDR
jgi:type II secretory pathway component GspD/PulD (secretin)